VSVYDEGRAEELRETSDLYLGMDWPDPPEDDEPEDEEEGEEGS
jgi:hypothetical protein